MTGAIYFNGAFALLLGGLYWKRASSTGAFLALLAGIFAVFGLSPVQHGIGMALNFLFGSSAARDGSAGQAACYRTAGGAQRRQPGDGIGV